MKCAEIFFIFRADPVGGVFQNDRTIGIDFYAEKLNGFQFRRIAGNHPYEIIFGKNLPPGVVCGGDPRVFPGFRIRIRGDLNVIGVERRNRGGIGDKGISLNEKITGFSGGTVE